MFLKRSILAGLAIAAAFALPAAAADLPVKARQLPATLMYPTGSGWFFGVGASGLGGTAGGTVTGGAIFGGTVSASVGYTRVFGGGYFAFVDQAVKATALNGASSVLKLSQSVEFETRLAVGAPDAVIAQWASAVGVGSASMPMLPLLPSNLSIAPGASYGFISLHASDVSAQVMTNIGTSYLFSAGAGIGKLYRVSNGMAIDTSVEYVHQSTGLQVGVPGLKVQYNDKIEMMASLKF